MDRLEYKEAVPRSPLAQAVGKVLALVIGLLTIVVAFMFSLVILAIVAAVVLVVGSIFWWRTRALRKHLREELDRRGGMPPSPSGGTKEAGRVIEGEVVSGDSSRPN